MKKYEQESLVKNFLVFFSLLEVLLILLFVELYSSYKNEYKQGIYKSMQVCSYTMDCPEFNFDFALKKSSHLNVLYEDDGLYAFFIIPDSKKFNIKISYAQRNFSQDLQRERNIFWLKFIATTFLLLGISLFFTFYSLEPIRNALQINDEFIKDILHDFNTPITTMVLNMKMYKEDNGDDPYLQRISYSISTIKQLQDNLKSFLRNSPSQNQKVDIATLAEQRLMTISEMYPKIRFIFQKDNGLIGYTNQELLTRVLDNILSNAGKYNRVKGTVTLSIAGDTIRIKDTGKGIQEIRKVTKRYYKEQDRGVGLGLHIVKKLVNELNIKMTIKSQIGRGTEVILDLSALPKEER